MGIDGGSSSSSSPFSGLLVCVGSVGRKGFFFLRAKLLRAKEREKDTRTERE